MKTNSSSIYGATRSPFLSEPTWGLYTKKSGKLFAHVFTWPTNGLLKVPTLTSTNTIRKIYLLNDTTTLLNYKDSLGYIRISVPANVPNPTGSVVVIDVAGLPKASTQYSKITAISVTGQGGLTTITGVGGTLQMVRTLTPTNATNKTVTWTVSDTTVATISISGLVTAKKAGSVTVTATANDDSDIFGKMQIIVGTSATLNPQTSSLKVYPNPANNGTVHLQYDNSSDLISYSLADLMGREKLKGTFTNHTTLNLANCKQGIYMVKIENKGDREVRKLLVN